MSPLLSPENSQGSTITIAPGFTHNLLLNLPGILQILVLPSKHFTSSLLAPSFLATIPKVSLPLGIFILLISCSCFCCASSSSSLLPIINANPKQFINVFKRESAKNLYTLELFFYYEIQRGA